MPVTNFTAGVGAVPVGDPALIDKLAAGLTKIGDGLDAISKKSEQVKPPKWDQFATSVKDFIQNPLQAAGNAAESFLTKIGPMGAAVSVGAVAMGALGKAGFEAMKSLGSFGDEIEDTAARMGMTTKEVAQFRFAMKYAGGDMGQLEGAMRKLSQEIEGGGKNLREMGVNFRDVHTGALLPTSAILLEMVNRLKAIPEGAERNAAAIKVMGRAALEVLPDLMELPEGLQRAEELQKNYTPAQLARWKEYQHQVAEIESAWESLKRSMKEPLAAVVSVSITGGKVIGGITGIPAALLAKLLSASPSATDTEMGETGGYGYGAYESRSAHRAQAATTAALVKIGDARLDAFLGSTAEDRLELAKNKLKELRAELEKYRGTVDSASEKARSEYSVQLAKVQALELEAKATKELASAVDSLVKQYQRVPGFVGNSLVMTSPFEQQLSKQSADLFAKYPQRAPFLQNFEAQNIALMMNARFYGRRGQNPDDLTAYWNQQAAGWMLGDTRAIAEYGGAAGHQGRMAGLTAGPGGELAALQQEMAYRMAALQNELRIKEAHSYLYDIDEERWRLQQEMQAAGYEYEEKVAELRRRGMEEQRSLTVGAYNALLSGGGGLKSFGLSQITGMGGKVVGNLSDMLYRPGAFSLPGTGTAENPTWLGRAFSGTLFGPEAKLSTAGDKLILAGGALMEAARVQAMSATGGGGGFVPQLAGAATSIPGMWTAGGKWSTNVPENEYLKQLADPNGAKFNWGKAFGYGAGIAAGGYGVYSGIKAGGGRGALTATASALGTAAMLDPEPISKTILAVGALFSGLFAGAFDPKKRRAEEMEVDRAARAVTLPTGADYVEDIYGRGVGYDYRGNLRPIVVYNDNRQYSAVDAPSFVEWGKRNPGAVSSVLTSDLLSGNGEDAVGTLQERLA